MRIAQLEEAFSALQLSSVTSSVEALSALRDRLDAPSVLAGLADPIGFALAHRPATARGADGSDDAEQAFRPATPAGAAEEREDGRSFFITQLAAAGSDGPSPFLLGEMAALLRELGGSGAQVPAEDDPVRQFHDLAGEAVCVCVHACVCAVLAGCPLTRQRAG